MTIERLDADDPSALDGLSAVLVDCVAGGAGVSFMCPLAPAKAQAFWRGVLASAARGERIVLVARDAEGIAGTVQVVLDSPENQPHRGELAKMLVHRRARRQGLGRRLLAAAEAAARDAGKTLLVLDTVSGGVAEAMYAAQGWAVCGQIPRYALMPDGTPCSTTIFYKFVG